MAFSARETISFAIGGPLARGDLPGLYERVCRLLENAGADIALCDVRDVAADAVTVDALARLQLASRRHGCRIVLCQPSRGLREVVESMGLGDVLL